MEERLAYTEGAEQPIAMHPKKFALWLFIVSVVMIFAAMTSAFIVRQGEGNWLDYDLPSILWYTSGIILLSSASMHWAYLSAKNDRINHLKIALTITTALGLVFLVGQWFSWVALVERDVYFVGNPAGSFMYVLTGLHAAHLISGVIFLIIVLISSFRYQIHSKEMNTLEMCATYWHFLGGLWIYLFVFLLLNH
ncbi:cytochrome c oxidase subunit 3 [Echinicola vietnamensis]|uniref:Heme/copper-type cytochrome/quinol oxidase, subunit 3 n=1 Tax=Echinicola vietnamensis (strain DSM 17526 / LMG 23754 / KMM 6221) TaxID=926556 RepID=L0FYI2_ECHVK|nr:cytochrome c oxidase subunit 3 [Echinicola vietnamensis]AGA78357.1 heme/copper-type cytochrome/quinol oxidase, subunit 3 [Echinicola vietnamensis DSM 17526]